MSRRRIYLLHGLMGTPATHFGPQLQSWGATATLHPLELPGHGKSPLELDRPLFAALVERLRRHVRKTGAGHFVGVSFLGGSLALHLALAEPSLCASVVVTGYLAQVEAPQIRSWSCGFVALLERNAELRASMTALHGERWRDTLRTWGDELGERYPAVDDDALRRLSVPLLVINGGLKSRERAEAVRLAELSHGIQAGVLPGVGHVANIEAPALFNLMTERFWNALEELG